MGLGGSMDGKCINGKLEQVLQPEPQQEVVKELQPGMLEIHMQLSPFADKAVGVGGHLWSTPDTCLW